MLGECARVRHAPPRIEMSLPVPGTIVPRAIIASSKFAQGHAAMEAEQINLIANTLGGIEARTAELRRYL